MGQYTSTQEPLLEQVLQQEKRIQTLENELKHLLATTPQQQQPMRKMPLNLLNQIKTNSDLIQTGYLINGLFIANKKPKPMTFLQEILQKRRNSIV